MIKSRLLSGFLVGFLAFSGVSVFLPFGVKTPEIDTDNLYSQFLDQLPSDAEASYQSIDEAVWNTWMGDKTADIKQVDQGFVMDTMPYRAEFSSDVSDGLVYEAEGKYISFEPAGLQWTTSEREVIGSSISAGDSEGSLIDGQVRYEDVFGSGVGIEASTSETSWEKDIVIDSFESLGDIPYDAEYLEVVFRFDTDFDIADWDGISEYQFDSALSLGGQSKIEPISVWDSSLNIENCSGFLRQIDGQSYLVKQILIEYFETASYPVYTDVNIIYGTAQEFGDTNHSVEKVTCSEIDTDKFVVVYADLDVADYPGYARVGTVSGTTITWGAISEFASQVFFGQSLGVCKLDTDKFVVVYGDRSLADDGYARVGTVATRTISWGTAVEFETGDMKLPNCTQLGTDKFAIVYNDETAGDLGTVSVCTVSGTTITAGTPVAFEGQIFTKPGISKLDTDKFVTFYADQGDSAHAKACAFTVSGTTPTAGAIKVIDDTGTCYDMAAAQLDTDKFVIAWNNETDTAGYIEICTVSGTTITEGAEVEFNPDNADHTALAAMDATHFILVYSDDGNGDKGTSRYCSFSVTTITLGDEEIFHNAVDNEQKGVCLISTDRIVVAYTDVADVNDIGEAIVGNPPDAPTMTTQAVGDITGTTATGNGNITVTGGENADHRGFVWDEATHGDPGDVAPGATDYSYSVDEAGSFGTGAFTGSLTGLDPGTLYYVRAYGHNSGGYAYGAEVSFTTLAGPTVTTQAATSTEETTATLNGNITVEGETTPTIRGFEYDTDSGAPYTNDWNEVGSWGVGAYTHGLTGLTKGELYYYRAYATNTIDTGYGAEEKFLTKPDEPTGLTATNPSSGTVTLVWVKGTGAQDTVVRGKDGSYPANVADGYEVYNGAGTTDNDTGLTGGHTYYYRAWSYATEGGESQYSDTYSQDNQYVIALPTTTTQAVGYTGMTIVTFNGNITATGGENNDYRGFAWGTASHGDPGNIAPAASAYTSYWPDAGSFGTGAFIYEDAVLIAGTTYYVRSYTHNSMGWSYGAEVSFGTLGQELWWQPATMVISNAVDRTGNGNHGTINWGENPLGVETSVGGISSSGDFTPPGEEGEDFDILPIPSGWNVTATNTTGVTGFWLYDLVNRAAESLGFTAQTMYVIIGLIAATGVGFGALIGTGNMLGFAIGFGATAGLFAATGVMPWWIIIVIVAIVGMGIYTWRRG